MSVDTSLDLTVLNDLDFDIEQPCEFRSHPQKHRPADPAAWLIHIVCPGCGQNQTVALCESGRAGLIGDGVLHHPCGHEGTWGDFVVAEIRIPRRP